MKLLINRLTNWNLHKKRSSNNRKKIRKPDLSVRFSHIASDIDKIRFKSKNVDNQTPLCTYRRVGVK